MTPIEIALAFAAYSAVEAWLGKTNKVKAGSTLELGFNILKGVAGVFFSNKVK